MRFELQCDEGEGFGVAGAGTEVAVLVVAGGDGDVELAGAGEQGTAGRDDDRGIEAEAVVAVGPLVEGGVEVDSILPCRSRRELEGAAAGELLRLRPCCLRTAGVDSEVATQGQLLQADELCPLSRGNPDSLGQSRLVLFEIGVPAVLDGREAEGRPVRRSGPRRRLRRLWSADQADLLHGCSR